MINDETMKRLAADIEKISPRPHHSALLGIAGRILPDCTFKIALSLMGYDSGILKDTKFPTWTYSSKYKPPFQNWKQPQYSIVHGQHHGHWSCCVQCHSVGFQR